MNFKHLINKGLRFAKDNQGTIGSIVAVGGVIGCCVLSVRAGKKIAVSGIDELETKEKVKEYAKVLIPTGLCAGVTVFTILASNHSHVRKEAALLGLATMWKKNYKELDTEVTDKLGAEEASKIHQNIIKKRIENDPQMQMVVPTGKILVYEPNTDQYIETTKEALTMAMLKANEKLQKTFDVRLGYIIKLLGGTTIGHPEANELGWNWENEAQEYAWSYYGGPWIELLPEIRDDKRGAICLFYNVEPDTQEPEQMIYYCK